jgi:hypothetical protein
MRRQRLQALPVRPPSSTTTAPGMIGLSARHLRDDRRGQVRGLARGLCSVAGSAGEHLRFLLRELIVGEDALLM